MINKFGFELELNSFDQRNFLTNPLRHGEHPQGILEVSNLIANLNLSVETREWEYTNNNKKWVCKPDASCGLEICSPVFEFPNFEQCLSVLNTLNENKQIKIDDRCSFHVHIDVSDLIEKNIYNSRSLASVLAWWVKIEHIFIDFADQNRKVNQYCRCIGMTNIFRSSDFVTPIKVIESLGEKYLTLNTYHLMARRRNTIEFRLAESTLDVEFFQNWISLLIHFINLAKEKELPEDFCWLDFNEAINFLNLDEIPKIKIWFFKRLQEKIGQSKSDWWSENTRKKDLIKFLQMDK